MATQSNPDKLGAKERPIAFVLHDTNPGGRPTKVQLWVRPEDLSIASPSRMAITHTFGQDGAWADSFGEGVKTITLSGITGWGGPRTNGGSDDGYQHFVDLHNTVFRSWHALRDAAARLGNDPDKVKLILADGLDQLTWVVAPQNFVLKRNKSRPLMAQYNITMHRVADGIEELAAAEPDIEEKKAAAIESLENTVNDLDNAATAIAEVVSAALAPFKEGLVSFVKMTANLLRKVVAGVKSLTGSVGGVFGDLIGIAKDIARAGMNIAHTIAAVMTLPAQIKHEFSKLASAYSNMMCVLKNVFRKRRYLPQYDINGSGNCASTAGGSGISPYVSENTFFAVLKSEKALVSVTKLAAESIARTGKLDPLVAPIESILRAPGLIASGVSI